jgi:hypothetical protein
MGDDRLAIGKRGLQWVRVYFCTRGALPVNAKY